MIIAGPGLENCEMVEGRLEVKYAGNSREFSSIVAAVKFYYYLDVDASIWDITGKPALIEAKTVINR